MSDPRDKSSLLPPLEYQHKERIISQDVESVCVFGSQPKPKSSTDMDQDFKCSLGKFIPPKMYHSEFKINDIPNVYRRNNSERFGVTRIKVSIQEHKVKKQEQDKNLKDRIIKMTSRNPSSLSTKTYPAAIQGQDSENRGISAKVKIKKRRRGEETDVSKIRKLESSTQRNNISTARKQTSAQEFNAINAVDASSRGARVTTDPSVKRTPVLNKLFPPQVKFQKLESKVSKEEMKSQETTIIDLCSSKKKPRPVWTYYKNLLPCPPPQLKNENLSRLQRESNEAQEEPMNLKKKKNWKYGIVSRPVESPSSKFIVDQERNRISAKDKIMMSWGGGEKPANDKAKKVKRGRKEVQVDYEEMYRSIFTPREENSKHNN